MKDNTQETNNESSDNMNIRDVKDLLNKGYNGDLTSREAGNMVKAMIKEEEKNLASKYNETR